MNKILKELWKDKSIKDLANEIWDYEKDKELFIHSQKNYMSKKISLEEELKHVNNLIKEYQDAYDYEDKDYEAKREFMLEQAIIYSSYLKSCLNSWKYYMERLEDFFKEKKVN